MAATRERIAGLGLAIPFELWSWAEEIGAPSEAMAPWRRFDIRAEMAGLLPYPIYLQNDATAACGAELAFGDNGDLRDFIYFHIGAFVGGGLVLNGELYTGRSGNAAALGSMPVADGAGGTVQLIDLASLVLLERRLRATGLPPETLYDPDADWSGFGAHLDDWLTTASRGIAHAIAAAATIVDFEAAVIDGALPGPVRDELIDGIGTELRRLDLSGIVPPRLRPGTIGPIARALGGRACRSSTAISSTSTRSPASGMGGGPRRNRTRRTQSARWEFGDPTQPRGATAMRPPDVLVSRGSIRGR